LKAATEHRVVGTSVPRVDIPAKVAGVAVFVHDVRCSGHVARARGAAAVRRRRRG
jgi:hypothetical protein